MPKTLTLPSNTDLSIHSNTQRRSPFQRPMPISTLTSNANISQTHFHATHGKPKQNPLQHRSLPSNTDLSIHDNAYADLPSNA